MKADEFKPGLWVSTPSGTKGKIVGLCDLDGGCMVNFEVVGMIYMPFQDLTVLPNYKSSLEIAASKMSEEPHRSELHSMPDTDSSDNIDWEQRRYEISKDLYTHFSTMTPEQCLESADLFIAALKKKKDE